MATFLSACSWRRIVLNASGFRIYKDQSFCSPFASPSALPWVSPALAFPAVHRFTVRRFSGVYEDADTREILLELDAAGQRIVRPTSPDSLKAAAAPSGGATVTAIYDGQSDEEPATAAVLYYDNGTGIVDYVTPLATATLRFDGGSRRSEISFAVTGLTNGTTYLFSVRARTAKGAEDQNTDTASVVADTTPPAAVAGLGAVPSI